MPLAATVTPSRTDSDTESAVMVRLQSADSESHQQQQQQRGTEDWIVVDEDRDAAPSAQAAVHTSDVIGVVEGAGSTGPAANARTASLGPGEVDEAAMLAQAMEESRVEEIRRMYTAAQEEAELQRVLQLSKRESTGLDQAIRVSAAAAGVDSEEHGGSTIENGDDDDDDDDDAYSETGWTSSDDDDDDDDEGEEDLKPRTDQEIRMQAAERIRVLEAAGILVMTNEADRTDAISPAATPGGGSGGDDNVDAVKPTRRPPPPPAVKGAPKMDELLLLERKGTQRKPKPERPERRKPPRPKPKKSLPPVPTEPAALEDKMEDAYDRYLKLQKEVSLRPMSPPAAAEDPQSLKARALSTSGQSISSSPSASGRPSTSSMAPPGSPPPHSSATRPGFSHGGESSKTSAFLNSIKNMSRSSRAACGAATSSSGLIDRIGTPTPMSRPDSAQRVSRIVSGPVGRSSPGPQEGSSWSKIVGLEAIGGVPEMERKRQEAIFELINTEVAHVRDLQIVVEVFFNSMQDLLSEKASTVIFANIEAVLLAAVSFLSDLEDRQRESRLYVDRIGDVLARHMPHMQVYLPYCVNQSASSEILQAERARDSRIDIHLLNLRSSHPAARGLDLSSFLLIPMQRITRYPLLISQIARYTPESHADTSKLQQAQRMSEKLLNETNESIRSRETLSTLTTLSSYLWIGTEARLDLTQPTQFQGRRTIIKDATVTKSKSGRKLRVVLFNDLLLLLDAEREALYRMPIPLDHVDVVEETRKKLRRGEDDVWTIKVDGGEKVRFRCASAREATNWIGKVKEAREAYVNAKIKAGVA